MHKMTIEELAKAVTRRIDEKAAAERERDRAETSAKAAGESLAALLAKAADLVGKMKRTQVLTLNTDAGAPVEHLVVNYKATGVEITHVRSGHGDVQAWKAGHDFEVKH